MAANEFQDPKQYEAIFRSHFPELCRIVLPILKDPDLCKDTVQEVFVDLWRKRDSVNIQSTVKAYLYRAVVNKSLDHLRKAKRLQTVATESSIGRSPGEYTTDRDLTRSELDTLIQKGMAKMPPQCALIFGMSRFQGKKNREIAAELNLSIKTVENQMGKGLRIMRDYLRPYWEKNLHNGLLALWLWQEFMN